MAGFEVTTEGSAHRPPESLAESLRRTPDRLDPQGLPRPFRHLQRAASETNPEFIFHLLPRIEDSFRARQAMSACSPDLQCRNDRPDSAPRRPASPLRTYGRVTLCPRTHFWRTTGVRKRMLAFPRANEHLTSAWCHVVRGM